MTWQDVLHTIRNSAIEAGTAAETAEQLATQLFPVLSEIERERNRLAALQTQAAEKKPSRLLQFITVGFSGDGPGKIAPSIWNPDDGWQAFVDNHLAPVVERIGPVDCWLHRTGGVWQDKGNQSHITTTTLFEQMAVARWCLPGLMDFSVLAEYAAEHGIGLYGYIGFPRADSPPAYRWEPQPEHAQLEAMSQWYGEFIMYGFKGVGHDWSQNLPANSEVLKVNFPFLQRAGIEPIIEAVPRRTHGHLLGYSVTATEPRWDYCAKHREEFVTEGEIVRSGGRAIHLVTRPEQPVEDVNEWRFETAKALLERGATVAVPLDLMMRAGYPIEELAELAKGAE